MDSTDVSKKRAIVGGLGSGLAIAGMALGFPWWGVLMIALVSLAINAFMLKAEGRSVPKSS